MLQPKRGESLKKTCVRVKLHLQTIKENIHEPPPESHATLGLMLQSTCESKLYFKSKYTCATTSKTYIHMKTRRGVLLSYG